MSKTRANPTDSKRLSIDNQLKLIQKVQPIRVLYDKSGKKYLNLQIINNSWKKIEEEMNTEFTGRYDILFQYKTICEYTFIFAEYPMLHTRFS